MKFETMMIYAGQYFAWMGTMRKTAGADVGSTFMSHTAWFAETIEGRAMLAELVKEADKNAGDDYSLAT